MCTRTTMSALCMSLLLACQPVVFAREYPQESEFLWGRRTAHPNDISFDVNELKESKASAPSWTYSLRDPLGPPNWPIVAPACGAQFQSPINIVTSRALVVNRKVPLEIVGLTNMPSSITAENEGYSVKFTPHWTYRTRPMMRGGPLKTAYFFEQMHFHWGPNNTEGSEHTLDERRFPLELHLVFYNGLYSSFDKAKAEVDGLAVVGFLYEVVPSSSSFSLNSWANFLPQVRQPKSTLEIPFSRAFTLLNVVGTMGWPYYSYEGSLTTPPCLETVNWIVSAKRLAVTEQELNRLRSLIGTNGAPISLNYRPVQPQNTRRVFYY
ncbi:carbonic anhydrase 7-like [Anopheles moucheti]|uniref:carbonic anhydrase 7-like n=1 Tax=Anopheles moucheti TaxID=186751 RepID=UPI0022F0E903|nr:carbonic anhydrase 7-like [Anopheles moucheti]